MLLVGDFGCLVLVLNGMKVLAAAISWIKPRHRMENTGANDTVANEAEHDYDMFEMFDDI